MTFRSKLFRYLSLPLLFCTFTQSIYAADLPEIVESGVLRHLGVLYANFVTGSGDGLDVELMQGFADHLGVSYQFVQTDWKNVFGDLTGRHARRSDDGAELLNQTPIKGDIIANGMTILPWRQQVVDFSDPTFPSAVWLVARSESSLSPIVPSGSLDQDILQVKNSLTDISVLALESTCLDPNLYRMYDTKAEIRLPDKTLKLNEMAPAILNGEAETALLDVPDALIALEKWPGQLKVIGPISDTQNMGVAFRKDSPKLRAAFNDYLAMIRRDGTYEKLVEKYYPSVFLYYADFFSTDDE
ncbi:MAG: transporter substrate-binding domain-containing protein [Chromatiales bacterium]|jgi:ABC-type amino acid transport substrate-binding protein